MLTNCCEWVGGQTSFKGPLRWGPHTDPMFVGSHCIQVSYRSFILNRRENGMFLVCGSNNAGQLLSVLPPLYDRCSVVVCFIGHPDGEFTLFLVSSLSLFPFFSHRTCEGQNIKYRTCSNVVSSVQAHLYVSRLRGLHCVSVYLGIWGDGKLSFQTWWMESSESEMERSPVNVKFTK